MGSPPWDPGHPLLARTYASQPLPAPPWGASSVSLELLPPQPPFLAWKRGTGLIAWNLPRGLWTSRGGWPGSACFVQLSKHSPYLPQPSGWVLTEQVRNLGELARCPAGSEGPCQVSSPALFAHPIRPGRSPPPCLGGSVLGRIKWGTPCTSVGNRTPGEQPLNGVPRDWARSEAGRMALHFVRLCRLTG